MGNMMIIDFNTALLFLSAAIVLAFVPGPGMLYVLSRTLSGGKTVGLISTLGASCGGMVHVVGAAVGISALLATSALAFTIIKYAGALFLVYLGLKILLSAYGMARLEPTVKTTKQVHNKKRIFFEGVATEMLNPKTAIFFLAFIPQFIQPENGSVFIQFIVLGVIVVLLNTLPDLLIACFSQPIASIWVSNAKFRIKQQMVSGFCLIGLGAYLAVSDQNSVSSPAR